MPRQRVKLAPLNNEGGINHPFSWCRQADSGRYCVWLIATKKTTTDELLDKIARLEARFEKQAKTAHEFDQLLREHCNTLERQLGDAYERIKILS